MNKKEIKSFYASFSNLSKIELMKLVWANNDGTRPPAEKQHRKEAIWPYIGPCRFLQSLRIIRVFFPNIDKVRLGSIVDRWSSGWPQDIPALLYAFVSIRPRVLSKDKICTSLGSLFNLHLLLNEHAPVNGLTDD